MNMRICLVNSPCKYKFLGLGLEFLEFSYAGMVHNIINGNKKECPKF